MLHAEYTVPQTEQELVDGAVINLEIILCAAALGEKQPCEEILMSHGFYHK